MSLISRLAAAESLLVVSDFDGTLAGFSPDIYGVPVDGDALAALTRLAGQPSTHVAVLSGRHLAGLRQVCRLRPPILFAGSHGSESAEHGVEPSTEQAAALQALDEALVFDDPRVHVEAKPFQRVVHTALLAESDPAAAEAVLAEAMRIEVPGARVARGRNIAEFSVSDITKGTWIAAEIARLNPSLALFIGDDTTDEDGFRALRPGDVGIKVGDGETAATERVADIPAVAALLTELADARATIPRDLPARFEAVAAGFSAEVLRVADWDAAAPCDGWAASDIVDHLITWYPANLRNASIDISVDGDDPAERWFHFVDQVRALLADDRATTTFHSGPDEGSTVARATAGFLLPDIFMHTWDLARSQGRRITLHPDYAARNLAGLQSLGDALRETGQFGPPRPAPVDAGPGEQLMAYVGREVR